MVRIISHSFSTQPYLILWHQVYRLGRCMGRECWAICHLSRLGGSYRAHQARSAIQYLVEIWTSFFLGMKRCARCVGSTYLIVLSIQPKQNASSTASLYKSDLSPDSFIGKTNHISLSVSKFSASHILYSCLSLV